jgi:tetratricopeptide (TPR) repeat protein
MRVNSKWLAVLLLLAVIPLSGCNFVQKLRARDNLNKGVKAFTEQKYDAAAQFFEKSIQMDPDFEVARMYLATAYTSQFVPGSTDPKSEEMASKGIETFKQVVEGAKDPANPNRNAMLSIASLYYQLKKYPESKEWCNKVLKVDPQNAEAYYRIAVIDFDDTLEKTGIQGENVEFMSLEEKATTQANIDEALTALNKALEIRPNYFDAMEYQNLLWREKAKFEKDEAAKAELIRQADLVSQKALALKLKAQEEEAKKPKKLGGLTGGN